MNNSIIKLEDLKNGFLPSDECLKMIIGTRKRAEEDHKKLGSFRYYGWFNTEKVSSDRNLFWTAIIIEAITFAAIFYYLFLDHKIEPKKELPVLIVSIAFVFLDILTLYFIGNKIYVINKFKQMLEMLPGKEPHRRNQYADEIKKANYNRYYWALGLLVSFALKAFGLLGVSKMHFGMQLVLIIFALAVLFIHYNFSPYYINFWKASKKYNKECAKSKHRYESKSPNETVKKEKIKISEVNYINPAPILAAEGMNFTVYSLNFDQAGICEAIIYNDKIILDDVLISTIEEQHPENKNATAELLISLQTT